MNTSTRVLLFVIVALTIGFYLYGDFDISPDELADQLGPISLGLQIAIQMIATGLVFMTYRLDRHLAWLSMMAGNGLMVFRRVTALMLWFDLGSVRIIGALDGVLLPLFISILILPGLARLYLFTRIRGANDLDGSAHFTHIANSGSSDGFMGAIQSDHTEASGVSNIPIGGADQGADQATRVRKITRRVP